ncbi:MAG: nuclear transport factor 2 family protein [FCB group bacterium]|nr:nuclear transport factor 2 family protein [FCB group bacterium]
MKRIFVYSLLAAAAALVVACCGKGDLSVNNGALAKQIRQADRALLQAEEQRDLNGAMALIAPRAVFQPPGFAPIVGREAIKRFYEQQWFKLPYREISGKADTIVVAASGDLGYFDGRSYMVLEIAGEQIRSEGKYLGVWQRIEGQWKLAAISWTANEAAR